MSRPGLRMKPAAPLIDQILANDLWICGLTGVAKWRVARVERYDNVHSHEQRYSSGGHG